MKKEDQLLEELLKEHAKGDTDKKFITDVEEKISNNTHTPLKKNSHWYLKGGIAAALILGATGLALHFSSKQETELVLTDPNISKNSKVPDFSLKPQGREVHTLEVEDKEIISPVSESTAKKKSPINREIAVDEAKLNKNVKTDHFRGAKDKKTQSLQEKTIERGREQVGVLIGRSANQLPTPSPKKAEVFGNLKKQKLLDSINVKNSERYAGSQENDFIAPKDNRSALSTFAVDVDTASYTNLRKKIQLGQAISKNSIRIEEMINYFNYAYPTPDNTHPFGVNIDSMACPWAEGHQIVRVGLQGKDIIRKERPPANLVFLLDVSGSMSNPDKLPLLKKSMSYLVEELNEKDKVSIVVYAGSSGCVLPATSLDNSGKKAVIEAFNKLSAGGSTAGGAGIKLAYKLAAENFIKDGVNRIILATDGDFNVGVSSDEALTKLVKEKAKSGTYLSVLGFGTGNLNDSMLEKITNNGNGNYSYIDSEKEGRKVLLEDMLGTLVTIAKDVKVQVEMNPAKVKAYRLIGYANRMLKAEDFLDKKVDAGEIGAGHSVTALYEIIPFDGTPYGPSIEKSRYFKDSTPQEEPAKELNDNEETLIVKLAYKYPNQKIHDESTYVKMPFTHNPSIKPSKDLQFATAVGLFGMLLSESQHSGDASYENVIQLAEKSLDSDGAGYKKEFIQLVNKLNKAK